MNLQRINSEAMAPSSVVGARQEQPTHQPTHNAMQMEVFQSILPSQWFP